MQARNVLSGCTSVAEVFINGSGLDCYLLQYTLFVKTTMT